VFEAASGSTVTSAFMVASASDGSLDLDADGVADVWAPGLDIRSAIPSIPQGLFIYRRRKAIEAKDVILQASQDGQTWTGLTPEIDYSTETIASDAEASLETLRLTIPATGDNLWQFRLISSP
jgi:hypothetical protein